MKVQDALFFFFLVVVVLVIVESVLQAGAVASTKYEESDYEISRSNGMPACDFFRVSYEVFGAQLLILLMLSYSEEW